MPPPSVVQTELIRKLEADGVLTPAAARTAREHYVTVDPPTAAARAASLLTLINAIKALGVAALLLAFIAFIDLITPWLAKLPIETYQIPLLAVAAGAALRPDLVWRAQAPYVAILATFATYITLIWMLFSHQAIEDWLDRLEGAGWPITAIIGAASLAIFAAAACMHASPLLAVTAAICLSWVLCALDFYIDPETRSLRVSVAGHLAALAVFISFKARGLYPDQIYVFTYAVEYYCTAALAFSLWAGCAMESIALALLYTVAFAALGAAACVVHYRLAIKTPASIFVSFAVLVMVTWVSRLEESLGSVITLTLCGVVLFGCGLLLERHRGLLVFEAPRRPGGPGGGPGAGQDSPAMPMPTLSEDGDRRHSDAVPLMGSDEAC